MRSGAVICALFLRAAFSVTGQELPGSGEPGSFEVEPPLLPGNLKEPEQPSAPPDLDRAERKLGRARERAAESDRLVRLGVLSTMEAENRALQSTKAETEVARARLAATQAECGTIAAEDDAARRKILEAQRVAEEAAINEHRFELELATTNVRREQKLLALGSGRRSAIRRAQEKLAQLQSSGK